MGASIFVGTLAFASLGPIGGIAVGVLLSAGIDYFASMAKEGWIDQ